MSSILLWVGLTLIVGVSQVFSLIGLGGIVSVCTIIGGIFMIVGSVLLVLKR